MINDINIDNIINETNILMNDKCNLLKKKIISINSNKLSINFFNNLVIKFNHKKLLMKNIANIILINNNSLKIYIYDIKHKKDIIKALNNLKLGYTIISLDKNSLKLIIPPITLEQKKTFIKLLKQELNNINIIIRNIRLESKNKIKKLFFKKIINKNVFKKKEIILQNLNNKYLTEITMIINHKIKQLNN